MPSAVRRRPARAWRRWRRTSATTNAPPGRPRGEATITASPQPLRGLGLDVAPERAVRIAQPDSPVSHDSSPSTCAISRRARIRCHRTVTGVDAERARNLRNRDAFELGQHENRPPARRQQIERLPHHGMRDQPRFGIDGAGRRDVPRGRGAVPHRRVPPVVAADIDQHPDQPGLFAGRSVRDALRRPRHAQKRFLDEIGGIVRTPRQPPRQPEQALMVRVEQLGHPAGRVVACSVHRCRDRHAGVRRHHWECRRGDPQECWWGDKSRLRSPRSADPVPRVPRFRGSGGSLRGFRRVASGL